MNSEGYQPTPEEEAQVEDTLHRTVEGAASEVREDLTEEDKALLDAADLWGGTGGLSGTIEGKEVNISHAYPGGIPNEFMGGSYDKFPNGKWIGSLDGKDLSPEEAENLYNKYYKIARYQMWSKEAERAKDGGGMWKSINNKPKA